jgi:immune inhibitor A
MSSSPRQRRFIRPLFALGVLLVAIAALSALAINYARTTPQAAQQASPTARVAEQADLSTPQRPGGLTGPPLPANTATAVASPESVLVEADLSPAEQSALTLSVKKVPPRDLYAITARLRLKSDAPLPRTTGKAPGNYKTGHSDVFHMSDIVRKNYYTVTATIHEVTEHAYWYVQDGQSVDVEAVRRTARDFEERIYPTNRALFGSEWTPGVDNDPRITVLFAPIAGAGGYYSSADEYTRAVNPYSNEREIIYININGGWVDIESTLAHEFQHMIHWHQQANHDVWLNEGAAVLASALNGYDMLGVDADFMRSPDTQLNAWQANPNAARANYGASFLFLDFLSSQYGGDEMIRALVAAPGQGTDAVDHALTSLGYKERFADVATSWMVANVVDGRAGAGAEGLSYPDREVAVSPQVVVDSYPKVVDDSVAQFGADYIQLAPAQGGGGSLEVDFSGQSETRIISAPAHSGTHIWWSNRGDVADMTMTRSFDLRGLQSATLGYSIWFDVEEHFDYGYVEASTDGGSTWDTLKGTHTTTANPNGNNFGNGYTGKSADKPGADGDGWLREQIDLSSYAGKEVMLRFEYITDDGYNAQGIAIDDISIPELNYSDDAEQEGGWRGDGFVRVHNGLPQRYFLSVVKFKSGGFDIQPVLVLEDAKTDFSIEGLGGDGGYESAVLIVAGLTPHSIQRAGYEISIRVEK